jgi:hypothetical protein
MYYCRADLLMPIFWTWSVLNECHFHDPILFRW